MPDQSRERRTHNELIAKAGNQQTKQLVEQVLNAEAKANLPLTFTCECADPACTASINMTADEFALAHLPADCFIIKPGHEHPDIERVVGGFPDPDSPAYCIVEKFLL